MARILIVDDSVELLEILSYLIERHGDTPITFKSANNFSEIVQTEKPDVIILDVLLHGFNGRDLCKQIKSAQSTKNIPIILISASNSMLEEFEECLADAVLEKPFDLDVVYQKINSVLSI